MRENSTNNLQQLMDRAGVTLKGLSAQTGVPVSTIGAFKNGDRPLKKREHRKALEEFFGENIVEFPKTTEKAPAINEEVAAYKVRLSVWKEAGTARLEALLREYANERDWGAVKEITTELLNRKITDKLR
jgi:transcriptional regulator with XRE-family HTH domain